MKKQNLIFAAIIVVFGLLVAIAPYSFAHVCELGEKVMKCHWTARAELFTGIAISVLGLVKFLSDDKNFNLGVNVAVLLNSLGVILYPTVLIGVCGMAKMHCHSVTQPTLIVFGILIFVISAVQTLILWKKR